MACWDLAKVRKWSEITVPGMSLEKSFEWKVVGLHFGADSYSDLETAHPATHHSVLSEAFGPSYNR